ncbi:hypothetical protein LNKW23_44460 [Paralimibaculum aggregatum]|uniref:Class I SAM-dependent methyltransferase n=1 Tax=Paralimibaculum aggregatum TaxID=3036245 RepID=A0ABQ6LT31_9RHOB|nr:class I SAM-dependent methyltransferase [Limibaculum sp. NKW23]GMG85229.1 hypothetical protein LNKW23_44460 [Limibaculum sp. NKW23]
MAFTLRWKGERLTPVEVMHRVRGKLLPRPRHINTYIDDDAPAEALEATEFGRIYDSHDGARALKWLHYPEIYERHFGPLRGKPIRILEIGVAYGGSLEIWRRFFGSEAIIYGIDIDPSCAVHDGKAGSVRIGSQTDAAFLRSVVEEMGGIDLVIDDGSHDNRHIQASLDVLFPLLAEGGIYLVEDLHCSYWPRYSGGYAWPGAFYNRLKVMIDDMHHWYHGRGERIAATAGHLHAIHVYDSIAILEKRRVPEPVMTRRPKVGTAGAD